MNIKNISSSPQAKNTRYEGLLYNKSPNPLIYDLSIRLISMCREAYSRLYKSTSHIPTVLAIIMRLGNLWINNGSLIGKSIWRVHINDVHILRIRFIMRISSIHQINGLLYGPTIIDFHLVTSNTLTLNFRKIIQPFHAFIFSKSWIRLNFSKSHSNRLLTQSRKDA